MWRLGWGKVGGGEGGLSYSYKVEKLKKKIRGTSFCSCSTFLTELASLASYSHPRPCSSSPSEPSSCPPLIPSFELWITPFYNKDIRMIFWNIGVEGGVLVGDLLGSGQAITPPLSPPCLFTFQKQKFHRGHQSSWLKTSVLFWISLFRKLYRIIEGKSRM